MSADPLLARVIEALGTTLKETSIIGDRAYATVPDPLALRDKMTSVEHELNVDIHCIVHVHQQHATLYVTPR